MSRRNGSDSSRRAGINWNFVDSFDIDEILNGNGKNAQLKSFIKGFRQFQISDNYNEYKVDLMPKFLRLCQLSCEALIEKQRSTIKEKDSIIQKLQQHCTSLQNSYEKARSLIEQIKNDINPCPICKKKFKTPETLQNHIKTHHPQQLHHWNCLINNQEHISTKPEEITSRLSEINNKVSKNVILPAETEEENLGISTIEESEKTPSPEIKKIIRSEPTTPPPKPSPRKKVKFHEDSVVEEDSTIQTIRNKNVPQMLEDDVLEDNQRSKKKIKKSKKSSPTKEEQISEVKVEEQPQAPIEEDSGVTFIDDDDDDISFFGNRNDDEDEEPVNSNDDNNATLEDGLLQTTLPPIAMIELFDNNPESFYLENVSNLDKNSFVDEEPPIRF